MAAAPRLYPGPGNSAPPTQQGVATGTSGDAIPRLSGTNEWDAAQANTPSTLAYSGTVIPDFAEANNFEILLTGNVVLGAPINQRPGQGGMVVLRQDATGGRAVSYAADWSPVGGVPPVASTTPNSPTLALTGQRQGVDGVH